MLVRDRRQQWHRAAALCQSLLPFPQPLEACPALAGRDFHNMGTHQFCSSQPQGIRLILILPPSPLEEAAPAETLIPVICADPALLLMSASSAPWGKPSIKCHFQIKTLTGGFWIFSVALKRKINECLMGSSVLYYTHLTQLFLGSQLCWGL